MNAIPIIIGVILLAILGGKIIYDLAPIGYEDENGFHFGNPKGKK